MTENNTGEIEDVAFTSTSKQGDYLTLNAQLNLWGYNTDGTKFIQFDKDKEAAKAYFLNHVNPNTQWFTDLEEKLRYLTENDYYEKEFLEKYDFPFVKELFKQVYAHKHRFDTFMGAYKYYTSYTLRTFDGKRYLERFEDRVAITALYLAQGDKKLAKHLAEEIITGRFQPATPTFLNSGKAQRGDLVSCFPAGTLVDTYEGRKPIEQIKAGDKVLTHNNRYSKVEKLSKRGYSDTLLNVQIVGHETISVTKEHPFLIWSNNPNETRKSIINGDGSNENFLWVKAEDLNHKTDYVVMSFNDKVREPKTYNLIDYIDTTPMPESYKGRSNENYIVEDGVIRYKNRNKKYSDKTGQDFSTRAKEVKSTVSETEELGRFLGYYISEGYVSYRKSLKGNSPSAIIFTFGSKEEDFINDVIDLGVNLFNIAPTININEKQNCAKISFNSSILAEFILSLVGTGFGGKKLTPEIETAPDNFIKGMLVGIFRGDGCTTTHMVTADLVNPELIHQLMLVSTRLGLAPRTRYYLNAKGNKTGSLQFSGGFDENEMLIYEIGKNLLNYRGSKNVRFDTKEFFKSVENKTLVSVTSVTKDKEEYNDFVYNLHVEKDHTYSVNGIIVHNCFLVDIQDDLNSIGRAVNSALQLSKRGGGVALNLSNLRAKSDPIKKIENQSSGVVPVMKILEDSFSYANQLGARQGAGAVYLNAHHPDIMEFLDTKRENADEKIRIKTLSLGVVVPDITMELMRTNEPMYLFSPYDVEREYGVQFSYINVTEKYREMVDNPNIRKKKINPREFFQTLAEIQAESGYPYIMFEDAANRANNVGGKIIMSNLCVTGDTEILTDSGYRKVIDLYNSEEDFNVVVDNRAKDMDFAAPGVSVQVSSKMFKTAEAADVYKLSTAEGFEIRATEWHKFYVERDGEVVKLQMNEIELGDKLLVQPSEGAFGYGEATDLAYLAGVIAADGTFSRSVGSSGNINASLRIDLHQEKRKYASRIETAAANVLSGREDLKERQSTLTPTFSESAGADYIKMPSAPLAKLFKEYGFTAETKTQIPEFVLRGNKETQIAYLDGLFSLDGTVVSGKENVSIQIASINREHLVNVQRILLNVGIYSRIYTSRSKASTVMMPDGKGGVKEYTQNPLWTLRVTDRTSVDLFYPLVDWKDEVKNKYVTARENRSSKNNYNTHKFRATVVSIDFDGVEDVYDVTVDNGHSLIFNGISTGNCTEIFQPHEPSVINGDQTYSVMGKDISCNLGSLNVKKALESEDFGMSIETAIRALTQVSDLSNIDEVPTVKSGNRRSHAIGLGAMNLHGAFGHHHMYYGDKESMDLTNMFFYTVLYYSLAASNKIAKERKETFDGFENSKYATGEFFTNFIENPQTPVTAKVRKIFKNIIVPTADDWKSLANSVKKHGIYNQNLQAIPPTGSISYINGSTSSIHPIIDVVEQRKEGKLGTVFVSFPDVNNENVQYFESAYDIGYEKLMDIYSIAQYYVDQGCSLTLFFKDTATTKDMNKAQIYAYTKGKRLPKNERADLIKLFPAGEIKSLYYMRLQAQILDGTANTECVSCAL